MDGRDRDGGKLVMIQVKKHIRNTRTCQDAKKSLVYLLEKIDKEEHGKQITIVFDGRKNGIRQSIMYGELFKKSYFL